MPSASAETFWSPEDEADGSAPHIRHLRHPTPDGRRVGPKVTRRRCASP